MNQHHIYTQKFNSGLIFNEANPGGDNDQNEVRIEDTSEKEEDSETDEVRIPQEYAKNDIDNDSEKLLDGFSKSVQYT